MGGVYLYRTRARYFTEHDIPCAVVNWMVTWPAEKIRGHLIAPYASLRKRVLMTFKGRITPDGPRQTYPADLKEEIADMKEQIADFIIRTS